MDSKTTELLYTFDLADLRFFLLIAKKKYKIYTICISFSVIDRISYFTEYRKKIFK